MSEQLNKEFLQTILHENEKNNDERNKLLREIRDSMNENISVSIRQYIKDNSSKSSENKEKENNVSSNFVMLIKDTLVSYFKLMNETLMTINNNLDSLMKMKVREGVFSDERNREAIRRELELIEAMKENNELQENSNKVTSVDEGVSISDIGFLTAGAGLAAAFFSGFIGELYKQIRFLSNLDIVKNIRSTKLITTIETIINDFFGKINTFTSSVGGFFGKIRSLGELLLNKLSFLKAGKIGYFINPVIDIVTETWKVVRTFFGQISSYFSGLFKTISGISKGVSGFAKIFKGFGSLLGKLAIPITVIMAIFRTVKGFISGYKEGGFFKGLWEAVKGLWNSLIGDLLGMFDRLIGKLTYWIGSLLGFDLPSDFRVSDIFWNFLDRVKTWFMDLFSFDFFDPKKIAKKIFGGIPWLGDMLFGDEKPTKPVKVRTSDLNIKEQLDSLSPEKREKAKSLLENRGIIVNESNEPKKSPVTTKDEFIPGSITKRFEGGNVNTISSGINDPGGRSFGEFQIAKNTGTMRSFLESEYGKPFASELGEPTSPEFESNYKKLSSERGEELNKAQYDFIYNTHYKPVLEEAKSMGIDVSKPSMKEALFSSSVQHSFTGNKKILENFASKDLNNMNEEDKIKSFYEERGKYVSSLSSLSSNIKENIKNRYNKESSSIIDSLSGNSKRISNVENRKIERLNEVTKKPEKDEKVSNVNNIVNSPKTVNSTSVNDKDSKNDETSFNRVQLQELARAFN